MQLGQRVSPGTPLMAIVPLDQVWVDANFKEAAAANMRIGQPVTLTADLYGSKVEYHGTVAGFGAGTGAAFALLPAQNATGNWIKVVQRVPVRIALDPKELAAASAAGRPVDAGRSRHARARRRAPAAGRADAPAYATDVFRRGRGRSRRACKAIIAANETARRAGVARQPAAADAGRSRRAAVALVTRRSAERAPPQHRHG